MSQAKLPGMDMLRTTPMPKGWRPDEPPVLDGIDEVGFDLETTGLRWWEGDRPVGVCVSWDHGREARYLPTGHAGGNLDAARVHEWMDRELRGKRLVGLNIKFDAHMSREWGHDLEALGCTLGDVGHYAALLDDHRRGFSLEAIAQDLLGEGKVDGLVKERMADYPAWDVTPYGRQDAALGLRIQDVQRPQLLDQVLMRVADLEDRVQFAVLEMEKNAALIDVERLRRWVKESERARDRAWTRLAMLAGFAINPNKDADMERLFAERGIEIEHRTPTGLPSFTGDVLDELAKTDEVIAQVQVLARLDDLRSKFLLPYDRSVGDDGLLRFSLHQLRGDEYGTVSGRFSSSQVIRNEVGVNIQQVMSASKQRRTYGDDFIIRSLHLPRPGQRFLSADAKQVEFRIFVHMSKSKRLIKAYADDPETDFHELAGALVRRYRPDFERKQVKMVNFAKLFGAGIRRLAGMLQVSEQEGKDLSQAYDNAFPEARLLMQKATRVAETREYVRTILGRRARFPKGQAVRTYSALNRAIQGSAADELKTKAVMLHEARKDTGFLMRMTVHDEFDGDIQDDEGARRVKAILETQALPFDVPILWDVSTGADWSSTDNAV